GSLRALDDDIQKLIETLRASGELDNTVIIYIGDNGVHWGEHRIADGKTTPYEESIHVPLLMYDGRSPSSGTDERLVLNIDLAPTIADIANVTATSSMDGRSIFSTEPWREEFLTECWGGEDAPPFTSLHRNDMVFIQYEGDQQELYDLSKDPYQLQNLVNDPTHQAVVEEMNATLKNIEKCQGNSCP
ncbi:MAG: sulfatase/phosphatase domain-containing protein, partial [Patescibacteria group bacterium]